MLLFFLSKLSCLSKVENFPFLFICKLNLAAELPISISGPLIYNMRATIYTTINYLIYLKKTVCIFICFINEWKIFIQTDKVFENHCFRFLFRSYIDIKNDQYV